VLQCVLRSCRSIRVLKCIAVCCSVCSAFAIVYMCCSVLQVSQCVWRSCHCTHALQCVVLCCSVCGALIIVYMCCSVLQRVAVCVAFLPIVLMCCSLFKRVLHSWHCTQGKYACSCLLLTFESLQKLYVQIREYKCISCMLHYLVYIFIFRIFICV
jgi:hypothetical protein